MGKFFNDIPSFLIPWLAEQEMFWVATAPLSGGHVNEHADKAGTGVETIAHLREEGNARITVMFSAFQGPPRITRLFGTGIVHEYGTPGYDALIPPHTRKPGSRAAIVIDVHKVGTSCGYAVPLYAFQAHRAKLLDSLAHAEERERAEQAPVEGGLRAFWRQYNLQSIDGMQALESAHECERVPECVYDGAKKGSAPGGPKERWGVWANSALAREQVGFVMGLILGGLLVAVYVQLSAIWETEMRAGSVFTI
ncbi:hypothetical protein HWV62_2822 [Athelia sp. TMB]|nr:hypothetical protein HWV62_2822 [Athelia sp. TMB]